MNKKEFCDRLSLLIVGIAIGIFISMMITQDYATYGIMFIALCIALVSALIIGING